MHATPTSSPSSKLLSAPVESCADSSGTTCSIFDRNRQLRPHDRRRPHAHRHINYGYVALFVSMSASCRRRSQRAWASSASRFSPNQYTSKCPQVSRSSRSRSKSPWRLSYSAEFVIEIRSRARQHTISVARTARFLNASTCSGEGLHTRGPISENVDGPGTCFTFTR